MSDIVNKLWGFCHTLRHDGVDYGDYIEQLTYLLFLKMMEEKGIAFPDIPNYKNTGAARPVNWTELKKESGTELIDLYAEYLRHLREQPGIVGEIYTQSLPRLNNPVNLKRLINLINEEEWTGLDVDVKGEAFEGLLERAASEGKKGAGAYFTPRPLIQSIVRVMKPDPRGKADFKITDPSCGTGGFLVAAYEWLIKESGGAFDRNEVRRIKEKTYYGQELVPRPRRLALMNLYLHGVTPTIYLGDSLYEAPRPEKYDVILANPPFGTKGANQVPDRDDFIVSTASKQLNFMQHFLSVLRPGGRAAVVLPDNCLFEDKASEIFKILMQDCDLHTIIRLPRGTFTPYAQGVKANVVFFRKGPRTEHVWIYDNRSNIAGITKKDRPLTAGHFAEFEACYGPDPNGQSRRTERERFKRFSLAEIRARGYKLDITWLKDESLDDADSLPEPQDLITEAVAELEAVVDELKEILILMETSNGE